VQESYFQNFRKKISHYSPNPEKMKTIYAFILSALLLIQCQVRESITPSSANQQKEDATKTNINERSAATTFYVSPTGNDAANGSATSPWKTLKYAVTKTPANQDYAIVLSEGTFIENGLIEIPLGVSIIGAGIDKTIIKSASSFYYYPATPSYSPDKFLISLNGSTQLPGNQTLSGFTIDGDGKKLHGGIFVGHRNNVTIDAVKVANTHFIGIWLWDVQTSSLKNSQIINASWGSAAYCVGALSLASLDRVDISNLSIDENTGYGVKAIGPNGANKISNTSIHDSRISVNPSGLWNSGSAPNFAMELYYTNLVGCQIYNNYIDNNISLVNHPSITSTGIQSIRVHHNILDMDIRAHGSGYGIELTVNDVEVDHNYFLKGTYGIVNWGWDLKNWNVHHNTFYGLSNNYPGEMVRSQKSGLHNLKFYNNTVEFTGTRTMNVIGLYGGASENVDIKNNLLIDNSTAYSYYANQLVHTENGAQVSGLTVNNNSFSRLPVGTVPGTYANNLTSDPLITKTGTRPDTYYMPKTGSPLIDKGISVGYTFSGSAPDIGALEFNGGGNVGNALPTVSLTSPASNSIFTPGTSLMLTATAADTDGSITKVEFFNGSTKLGEDLTAPYTLAWTATSGVLTTKATDDKGATSISNSVTVTINSLNNALPTVSITSPIHNSTFTSGTSLTITATAADSDGNITKVEFFNGATKLGEDLTAPYGLTWTAVSGILTAKVTDNKGATSVSNSVNVAVNSTDKKVKVSFDSDMTRKLTGKTL
jgi:hypothetical protein